MNPSLVKLVLVDDHPMLRNGVAQLISLEDNFEVVSQCNDGESAVAAVVKHQPDIVLLDLNMKGMSGIETLAALKTSDSKVKVVIFTVSDSEADVLQAIKYNADGYILKDSEPDELIQLLNTVVNGDMAISPPLAPILAKALRPNSQKKSGLEQLTQRELENLKLIAAGKTNKDIAHKLGITEATVKVHVKNLLKKLGLKTRVEAAIWAMEHKVH